MINSGFLDCSSECVDADPISLQGGRRQWIANELIESEWFVALSTEAISELLHLAQFVLDNPVGHFQRNIHELELPHCVAAMGTMKNILEEGVGFAVLDQLPIDEYPIEVILEVYWLLGQLMGRPVAQKWNGEMIYHVHDSGENFGYGVRGSKTNVELMFHTDNAFGRVVPDSVGLLCRNPARKGGLSRFCSLYTVHERLLQYYPESLSRLYQPMLFDRQKEHVETDPPVTFAPFFTIQDNRLYARANTSLVHKGYEVANETPDDQLLEALQRVDDVSSSPELWFEAQLERGQIQYLNNHEIGHYRSEFYDFDEPERKRYLYRLWHRHKGSSTYHGA